ENSDPVTFDVSYYNKPSTAGAAIPAPTIEQTDKAYTDIALDVSNFSSTGDYVVWIRLNDDSNGNDINRNYKFAGQDTNTTPATENVHVQLVQVGSGSVNVSGIKWGYKEGTAGVLTQITSSTNIEYKKVSGTAQNYIVEIDPATMPSYLEVDTSYGLNGFTLGYNENDKTDANTYTAVVRLKIASGNTDYKFESTGSNGYTYIDDTHAELTYQWTIAQKELDFTNAEWQFSIDAINDTDANATWKKYDTTVQGGQPEHQSTPVWVRISEAYLSSLGLTSGATGDVSFAYGSSNKNNPTSAAGTSVTTNVFVTILNSNYKNPASGNTYTFTWATTKKQINISNWNGTRGISGSDGAGGTKGFDFPAINVSNNDGNDYSTMVEYVYTYTLPNGVVKTNVTESEMIQDIYPIADMSNQISGIVTVRVKSAFAGQYDLNAGGSSLTAPFTCGDSKIMLDMGFGGTHTTYGDGGDFSLTASANGIDMLSTLGAYIEVTLTDKDGQVKVFTADNATAQDVLDFLANAGAYKFEFTLTNPAFSSSYGFTSSQLNYVVARKEIVVPQVIKALTFNGNDVIFTDHLDNQYTANSSMIDVTGDTQCRNVSQGNAYSVTLKLNDENYCWVLPASSQTPTKGLAKITLVDDTVETNVSIPATDPTRAVYSWNVAPLAVDTSKSWKDGKLTLPAELQNLVNSGDVTIKYNYYNDAGELLGDSESGFEPQGGVSYRIEAVLEGQDADGGNVVFVSSDGSISGKTSDRVVYTAPKSGMAKFKDTLTKKVAGLPLWAWIVIGVAALILLIILICIIVAAAKKKKKKEEEKAAKAEKEEAKAAAAAAAAAPMLAMSASMADEKAKLEA
ncbi:MAG: hypothetical protein K2N33_02925, partial [Clostridia bacterium]|nr:hypothetical protein [Clostridia bacterium]